MKKQYQRLILILISLVLILNLPIVFGSTALPFSVATGDSILDPTRPVIEATVDKVDPGQRAVIYVKISNISKKHIYNGTISGNVDIGYNLSGFSIKPEDIKAVNLFHETVVKSRVEKGFISLDFEAKANPSKLGAVVIKLEFEAYGHTATHIAIGNVHMMDSKGNVIRRENFEVTEGFIEISGMEEDKFSGIKDIKLREDIIELKTLDTIAVTPQLTPLHPQYLPINHGHIIWVSSNPEVAAVGSWGNVTAMDLGEAVITAMAIEGSARAEFKVVVNDYGRVNARFEIDNTLMDIGTEHVLELETQPSSAREKGFTWSSSDEGIVSVDHQGKIVAHAPIINAPVKIPDIICALLSDTLSLKNLWNK